MTLSEIIDILERAERSGNQEDVPEGARYIKISDTLSGEMISSLYRVKQALNSPALQVSVGLEEQAYDAR